MFLKVYPPVLCKKYANTGQMDKSQKTVSELIIAGSDAAKFFQFQEKGLYQMPFLISNHHILRGKTENHMSMMKNSTSINSE